MPLSNFEVPYRFYIQHARYFRTKRINIHFIHSEATIVIIVAIRDNETATFQALTERIRPLRSRRCSISDLLNSLLLTVSPRRLHLSEEKELPLIKRANGTRSLQVEVSVTS